MSREDKGPHPWSATLDVAQELLLLNIRQWPVAQRQRASVCPRSRLCTRGCTVRLKIVCVCVRTGGGCEVGVGGFCVLVCAPPPHLRSTSAPGKQQHERGHGFAAAVSHDGGPLCPVPASLDLRVASLLLAALHVCVCPAAGGRSGRVSAGEVPGCRGCHRARARAVAVQRPGGRGGGHRCGGVGRSQRAKVGPSPPQNAVGHKLCSRDSHARPLC
jgi:hypothetical protein